MSRDPPSSVFDHGSKGPGSTFAPDQGDAKCFGGSTGDWTFRIPDVAYKEIPGDLAQGDKDPLPPDYIMKVKVECEWGDSANSEEKVVYENLKADPDLMDCPMKLDCLELCAGGEVDSMERKPFQSNVPQTSQEALSKVSLKEELPDDPSEEVNDADQHVVERQRKKRNAFSCSNCSLLFNTNYSLKRHTAQGFCQEDVNTGNNHPYNNKSPARRCTKAQKDERPYKCSVCEKAFGILSSLNRHRTIHMGERPYKCSLCSNAFKLLTDLKTHCRIHTGKKLHKCSVCNKVYTCVSTFISHQRVHTGERPYECSVCSKEFKQSSDLNRHKRIHTGEKPYKCSLCPKAFVQLPHLHSHQKTHTGEKAYRCSTCNKAFTLLQTLKTHQRIHTGEKLHECSACGKTFTVFSALRRHQGIRNTEKTE